MKYFLRAIFIFLYVCLVFFINPNEAFSNGIYITTSPSTHYISQQQKTEFELYSDNECYYAVIQNNNNNAQIRNCSNKNDNINSSLDNDNHILNNIPKYLIINRIFILDNLITQNNFLNLKHTIYTRAP